MPTVMATATPSPTADDDRWERLGRGRLPPARAASPVPQPTASATPETPTEADVDAEADASSEEAEPSDEWRAFVPTDTADHLATMERAARESGCGVPWQLLAAIARVESDFGRNMSTSWAGAMGYGQFLPSSWDAFGNDGNIYDYHDALPAIARYLCRFGLATDPRQALFAYNHADWYVDLVLALAVRYDGLTPGGPTPDVLDVGPGKAGAPLHYAPGRDIRAQTRPHGRAGEMMWLGVPWRGRSLGSVPSTGALNAAALAMLRAAFGVQDELSIPDAGSDLPSFADRAWDAGLLPLDLFSRPGVHRAWTLDDVRRHLARGQPVVAIVPAQLLPGHPPAPADAAGAPDQQPIVLLGLTRLGFIYNDPSFASSLGYGLEISADDFENAWQRAALPHQAVAFRRRPSPPAREAHHRPDPAEIVDPPVVQAGLPVQQRTPVPRVLVRPTHAPTADVVATTPVPDPNPTLVMAQPPVQAATAVPVAGLVLGLGTLGALAAGTLYARRRIRC